MATMETLSNGLHLSAQGIYVATRQEQVSYPQYGHADCFQIEDRSFWFRHRNECIAALIQRHPPPAGPLLDIGGGNGYVSQRLQADGHDVVLIEPGPTGAANAKFGRKLASVVCATIEDAEFRSAAFAALGMFDVIEHIEDDRRFLAETARLLPAGGMLYLTVPCHRWLWSGADTIAGHFRRHTFASLRALLQGSFEIEYMSYFFAPLVLPQLLLRAVPYRLGLQRRAGVLSAETEHGTDNSLMTRMMATLLRHEVDRVASGTVMRFGSSCLLAARKK